MRTQNFTSTEEVLTATKEMFKDVVQEVLEAEMDDHLGYENMMYPRKKYPTAEMDILRRL